MIASLSESRLNPPDTHITPSPLEPNAILAKVKRDLREGRRVVENQYFGEAIAAGRPPRARPIHDNVAISISTSCYSVALAAPTPGSDSALFQENRQRSKISAARIAELIVPNIHGG